LYLFLNNNKSIKMSDLNFSLKVFVPDSCARTATVQITDPATTLTYIGAGELVVTGDGGAVLAAGDIDETTKKVQIQHRKKNGTFSPTYTIDMDSLVGVSIKKYAAPVACAGVVTPTDFAQLNHNYVLYIYEQNCINPVPYVVTVKTGSVAYTKKQLIDAFVAAINLRFNTNNTDKTLPKLTASNVSDLYLKVVADVEEFSVVNDPYDPTVFELVAIDDWGTIQSNKLAAITTPSVSKFEKGFGTGKQVAEKEFEDLGFSNSAYGNVMPRYKTNLGYDAVTTETYDALVIQVKESVTKSIGAGYTVSTAHIYLPITDNDTSQVADIVDVLNDICTVKGFKAIAVTA
jgi:hypothetical protein